MFLLKESFRYLLIEMDRSKIVDRWRVRIEVGRSKSNERWVVSCELYGEKIIWSLNGVVVTIRLHSRKESTTHPRRWRVICLNADFIHAWLLCVTVIRMSWNKLLPLCCISWKDRTGLRFDNTDKWSLLEEQLSWTTEVLIGNFRWILHFFYNRLSAQVENAHYG